MQAVYDLSRYPANFNFVEWLVAAKTLGATSVVLDDTKGYRPKYPKADTTRRMETIVEPASALAGLPFSYGAGKGIDPGYHISAVIDAYKKTGGIAKLKSVLPPKDVRYTVTLRNCKRYKERNSDREAWLKFAEERGALVIEDFEDSPMHMHERMALYAGAEMNYLVANGPNILLMCSDYPYTVVMKNVNLAYIKEHGWEPGSRLPWMNEKQRFVWSDDDLKTLRTL